MNRITVDDNLRAQLDAVCVPVEVCDESGRTPGHFVPLTAAHAPDDCPYTDDELSRMRQEASGRTLAEIWKSLGRA